MSDNRTTELLREAEREIVILRDKLRIANGTGAKTCVKCGTFLSDELLCTECAIAAWNTRHERTCRMIKSDFDELMWASCYEFSCDCGQRNIFMIGSIPPKYCPNCGARVVVE